MAIRYCKVIEKLMTPPRTCTVGKAKIREKVSSLLFCSPFLQFRFTTIMNYYYSR